MVQIRRFSQENEQRYCFLGKESSGGHNAKIHYSTKSCHGILSWERLQPLALHPRSYEYHVWDCSVPRTKQVLDFSWASVGRWKYDIYAYEIVHTLYVTVD